MVRRVTAVGAAVGAIALAVTGLGTPTAPAHAGAQALTSVSPADLAAAVVSDQAHNAIDRITGLRPCL